MVGRMNTKHKILEKINFIIQCRKRLFLRKIKQLCELKHLSSTRKKNQIEISKVVASELEELSQKFFRKTKLFERLFELFGKVHKNG